MSYVCPIHEQYVHDDKRCPYCVEPEAQPEMHRCEIVIDKSIWFDYGEATAILKKYYGGGG